MTYLVAAVVLVGVLCFIDLLLSFAVIRRLRAQAAELARAVPAGTIRPSDTIPVGDPVPEFAATTIEGARVSVDGLRGSRALVGFFSIGCRACKTQLPDFLATARELPGGAAQAVAIVDGERAGAEELLAALDGAAQIVLEPDRGAVSEMLAVHTFPTFYLLDERGRVRAGGHTVRRVTESAALV